MTALTLLAPVHTPWGPQDAACDACERSVGCLACARAALDEDGYGDCGFGAAHEAAVAGAHAAFTGETEAAHVVAVVASGLCADAPDGPCLPAGWERFMEMLVGAEPVRVVPWATTAGEVRVMRHEAALTVQEAVDLALADAPPPEEAFFEKKTFVPPALGEYLAGQTPFRTHPSGELWRYTPEGTFRPDAGGVGRRVAALLGERWQQAHPTATENWLTDTSPPIGAAGGDGTLINVSNGMLRWRAGELHPHSPEYGSITQVPWAWDPEAECPRFRAAFAHLPAGVLDLIFEVAGYLLVPANTMKRAILLFGPSDTGKSTLLDCLRSLVGAENVSSVTLHDLADNRFRSAELYGKLANIAGDLDAGEVARSDSFKMLVGGDEVTAERKHGHPFKFLNTATLVFSCNALPPTRDSSDAFFNRFLVIPMTVKPDVIDPSIKVDLPRDPGEMSGLLRYAVDGLGRLMDRGSFAPPTAVVEAGLAYRADADSVRSFFGDDELWELDPSASTPKTPAYRRYSAWCKLTNRRPVRDREFYNRIEADGLGLGLAMTKYAGERRITGARATGATAIEIDERLGF